MREKDEYRDNLEELTEYFGRRRLLTIQDVARYTGRTRQYVTKLYRIPKTGITTATLARRMCEESKIQ